MVTQINQLHKISDKSLTISSQFLIGGITGVFVGRDHEQLLVALLLIVLTAIAVFFVNEYIL